MGSIHDEPYLMLTDEQLHRLAVQCAIDALTIVQRDVLLTRLGAVVIDVTALFQHLHGLTPFRRSSEYQYHDSSPCLKRWVKYLL